MERDGWGRDVSRRDFMKVFVTASAMLGLPFGMAGKLAEAAMSEAGRR